MLIGPSQTMQVVLRRSVDCLGLCACRQTAWTPQATRPSASYNPLREIAETQKQLAATGYLWSGLGYLSCVVTVLCLGVTILVAHTSAPPIACTAKHAECPLIPEPRCGPKSKFQCSWGQGGSSSNPSWTPSWGHRRCPRPSQTWLRVS